MNGLYTTLIVLAVLLLVGLIRVGAQVEYCEQGFFARLRIGAWLVPLFPKQQKPAKEAKKKAADTQPQKKGGLVKTVLNLLPLVLDTVKKLWRKLRVDKLDVSLVVSTDDPADTAIAYGQANALLGALWQPLTQAFHVKDGHAHVGVDFEGGEPSVYLLADITLTIGQLICLAVVFGVKALGILIRTRTTRSSAAQQGKAV